MWRTPEGTRILRELEAQVARRGLETAIDLIELGIEAGDPWKFGVPQFDLLTSEQQLALLAEIGRALFYKSVRAPIHTAVNESGIYAIFRALETSIHFEIDGEDYCEKSSRRLVCEFVAAERARSDATAYEEEEDFALTPECCDIEEWEFAVDCIADRILWDRDFELDDLMVDSSPERAQFLKSYLGIDDEYFTVIAPDPRDLTQVRRTLRRLLQEKPR